MKSRKFSVMATHLIDLNHISHHVIHVQMEKSPSNPEGLLNPREMENFLNRIQDAGKDPRAYAIIATLLFELENNCNLPPEQQSDYYEIVGAHMEDMEALIHSPQLQLDYISFGHFVGLVKRLLQNPQSDLVLQEVESEIKEFENAYPLQMREM